MLFRSGSLADPSVPHEPVRPAPVNQPVELNEAVFTQDPILPSSERTASTGRAPRKRATSAKTAKKSVAAQGTGAPNGQVTTVLPDGEQPTDAASDPLNVGPVANRRRTRI